ncbi:fimbrillin family protein [Phocaeicola sartorii]|uniref:fimbrillin family protein n=1 Tax=Phocaeicola sartorii TaxID=671267 RepID=UPI00242AC4B0|nr:fimbrillin family protein [Phocaeicola sartorii]
MSKKIKLAGMVAMLSMTFVSCSNDELKEAYQGEKITFTTKVGASRAQVINGVADLESFRVHAEAHGDKDYTWLEQELAKKASGDNSSGIYKFETDKMWPADASSIEFWAYGPQEINNITHDGGLHIPDFSPKDSPKEQLDLVVAYTASKKTSGAVPLTFHHALSQVEVRAKCGADDKHVKIKGAWIVNLNNKGVLWYDKNATDNIRWALDDAKTYYGESFAEIQLSKDFQGLLAEYSDDTESKEKRGNSMMMLPQAITALQDAADPKDKGAYIVMLCRIESHHVGAYVNNHQDADPFVKDFPESATGDDIKFHHHQLYPQPLNGSYKEDVYGYTCVPITAPEGEWKPGKKYIYNLAFFHEGSGGGILPPTDPGLPDGGEETPGIDPGHPIVQEPISFTVTVEDWAKEEVTPSMK